MRQERTQLGLKDKIELLALAESWRIWNEIQVQLFLWAAILEDRSGQDIIEQRDGERRPYSWDLYNRLISVTKNGVAVTSYQYDADNLRVQRVGADGTTVYAYGRNGAITYSKNITTGKARTYVYLNDQVIGWTDTAADGTQTKMFAVTDNLGSVTAVTDSTAKVVWSSSYDPFGKTSGIEGLYDFDGSYAGLQPDPDTGLLLAWNRWLDPETGRFASEDPAQYGSNFYAYVSNNPINRWDPTGLYDWWAMSDEEVEDTKEVMDQTYEENQSYSPADDEDKKEMMKGAYRSPALDFKMPIGFRDMSDDELAAHKISQADLGSAFDDGFKARVYINPHTGEVVVAFAGTNDPKDYKDDVDQSLGRNSSQYNQAIRIATALNSNGPEIANLSFTGHSLGGGLATVAAIATNRNATTYNAAGVSQAYIDIAKSQRAGYEYRGRVTAYVNERDPLNGAQDSSSLPKVYGNRVNIPGVGLDYTISQHGWNSLAWGGFSLLGLSAFDNHMFVPADRYFGGQW